MKPQLARQKGCNGDRRFELDGITTHVIAHDVPAAFSFPNGRIYLTTGLIDPQQPWAARTDDELLGVIAHETVHLVDYHVVVHWAVVRQRHAEQMAQMPLLLTKVLPVSYKPRPLPLGAETYDERIEFLADSGAVTVLRGLGRSPDGYLALLNRMAGYPYFAEIGQPQRRDLLSARATCLDACLQPSRAGWRDQAGAVRPLTPRDQFLICTKSYIAVNHDDWRVVADWLQRPGAVPLNDVPERLSRASDRAAMEEVVSGWQLGEGPVIARAGLGERAQLEDGCQFGGEAR